MKAPSEPPMREEDTHAYFVSRDYPIFYIAKTARPHAGEHVLFDVVLRGIATATTFTLSTEELDEFERVFDERHLRRSVRLLVKLTVAPRWDRHLRLISTDHYMEYFQMGGTEFIEFCCAACTYLLSLADWRKLSRVEKFLVFVIVTQIDNVDLHFQRLSGGMPLPSTTAASARSIQPRDEMSLDIWNRTPCVQRLQEVRRRSNPVATDFIKSPLSSAATGSPGGEPGQ